MTFIGAKRLEREVDQSPPLNVPSWLGQVQLHIYRYLIMYCTVTSICFEPLSRVLHRYLKTFCTVASLCFAPLPHYVLHRYLNTFCIVA